MRHSLRQQVGAELAGDRKMAGVRSVLGVLNPWLVRGRLSAVLLGGLLAHLFCAGVAHCQGAGTKIPDTLDRYVASSLFQGAPAKILEAGKAEVRRTITGESVARLMRLKWPPTPTYSSREDVNAIVEDELARLADKEVPPFDEEACRAAYMAQIKPIKPGDKVRFTLVRPGPNRLVSGTVRQIDRSVKVGSRQINIGDIPEDILVRMFPDKAEAACDRHVAKERNLREANARAVVARNRERVTTAAYLKAGFVVVAGKWRSSAEIVAAISKSVAARRVRAIPAVLQAMLKKQGYVRYQGQWMQNKAAGQLKAEAQLELETRKEQEAAALDEVAAKASEPPPRSTVTGPPGKPLADPDLATVPKDFKIADVAHNIVIVKASVLGTKSVGEAEGSGFVCEMGGRTYVVTNQHVVAEGRVSFQTVAGKKLRPIGFEYSPQLDLARFPLEGQTEQGEEPFQCSAVVPEIGTPIVVVGNSGGRSVATAIGGKVVGVGPEIIESNAAFVAGNSGSPMLNSLGYVVGVATYATRETPDWVAKGTRFTKVRRFGHRLDDKTKFVEIRFATFQGQAHLLHDLRNYLYDLYSLASGDEDFMETYVPGKSTKYYDVGWGRRYYNLLYNQGILELSTTPVRRSEMADVTNRIDRLIMGEITVVGKVLRKKKWMSQYLREEATSVFRTGQAVEAALRLIHARLLRRARY
jgi:S1-C subfamily serine protease